MLLHNLSLVNFRNFESAKFDFSPGLNYLVGDNGAGKTSVLEALNLYWNGRSFRSRSLNRMVNVTASESILRGEVAIGSGAQSTSKVFALSISNGTKGKVVKYDNETIKKSSYLARLLPVFYYSPSNVSLVSGSPSERRKLLNWFMFHVEPNFNEYYQRLKFSVSNRNRLLRTSHYSGLAENSEFDYWEAQLTLYSTKLSELVNQHLNGINAHFGEFNRYNSRVNDMEKTRAFHDLVIEIGRGWNDSGENLQKQLKLKRHSDAKNNGVTSCGFHRSDLYLVDKNHSKIDNLSRGEEKSLGLLLILSMLALMKSYKKAVLLLIDDLHSELDFGNAKFIISTIVDLGFQSIVTCIDDEYFSRLNEEHNYKMFHVKQGNICEDN